MSIPEEMKREEVRVYDIKWKPDQCVGEHCREVGHWMIVLKLPLPRPGSIKRDILEMTLQKGAICFRCMTALDMDTSKILGRYRGWDTYRGILQGLKLTPEELPMKDITHEFRPIKPGFINQ